MRILREHSWHHDGAVKLLQSGAPFFETLLKELAAAKEFIHFQFYILDEDETGKRFIRALLDAADRGVKVAVFVDGYASQKISPQTLKRFSEKGILFRRFSPIRYRSLSPGRRMHHKVVCIDHRLAFVGGINIAQKYAGSRGHEPWLDFAVQVSGRIVREIEQVCEQIWRKRKIRRLTRKVRHPEPLKSPGTIPVRLLRNDWLRGWIEISRAYKHAIRHAEKEVVIVASYFFPGTTLRRLIHKARERGVRVVLVTGSFSDVAIFKPALHYLYSWLLKNEVELYEWNKSVLHGKLAVADRNWVTVGSYNLNALSDYGSLELNVEVKDEPFARETCTLMENLIATGCTRITAKDFTRNNTMVLQVYRWVCYQILRLLFRLVYLVFKRP